MENIDEGQLFKYTNVMKGWQHRWFVLNKETGVLEYYMCEDPKKHRPRGSVYLGGAVISPSEEDSCTFNVSPTTGEVYRLRADGAKERQLWVQKLRTVAESHSSSFNVQANSKEKKNSSQISNSVNANSELVNVVTPDNAQPASNKSRQRAMCNTRSLYDTFSAAQEILKQVEQNHYSLTRVIESLPSAGLDVRCTDTDVLLMKATSQATLLCLKQCHTMLQQQQQAVSFQQTGVTGGATMEIVDPLTSALNWNNSSSLTDVRLASSDETNSLLSTEIENTQALEKIEYNSDDEVSDDDEQSEAELGPADDHRAVILQMLPQMKLGMDLTQVVLPTFILESYSLLEMFANFMSHSDIFLEIPDKQSAEDRIVAVVEWYLTSFHIGRKSCNAKKPYNPILGELFFCSWNIDRGESSEKKLKFIGEQVSHHPPVSAFYVESSDKTVCLNASIWTKSKFMGMAVGVNMIGEAVLRLQKYEEEYVITFPSAFARSILNIPWFELGGKVTISCAKTGCSASVTFQTKPFYGGKANKVIAEIKNNSSSTICRVQGEWNGELEFTYSNGESKLIDTNELKPIRKYIRPLSAQCEIESRAVWKNVSEALRTGNMKLAAETKRNIEERQRRQLRQWKESGYQYNPRFFVPVNGGWEYKNHLKYLKT